MRFSHFVDIPTASPTTTDKKDMVEAQLDYLYGALSNAHYKGAPRGDHKIEVGLTEVLDEDTSRVYYNYEGTVLLQKGPRTHISIPLPRMPTQEGIYDPALDAKGFNHSTDPQEQDFDDFWYFWNPTQRGSRLKEGTHFDKVDADIQRIKNVPRSYPQYDSLIQKDGVIRISAMFGMDDVGRSRNVNLGKDLGAMGYRGFRKGLVEMGFKKSDITKTEKERIFGTHRFRGFTLEKLTKKTSKGPIEVLLFFGPSGNMEPSRPFHYLFKDALENASVVVYDGHSGLGANLDLKDIEKKEGFKIERHPRDYQILFLNSCTSYSYYNLAYHRLKDRKDPTQYLDILANGLSTAFDETQKANLALIRAIDRWATRGKKQSYQSLATIMDDSNLFSVNGDEKNKTE